MLQSLICPSREDGIRALNTSEIVSTERPSYSSSTRSLYLSSHNLEMASKFCALSLLRGANRKIRLPSAKEQKSKYTGRNLNIKPK